jgi:cytochrome P450
MLTRREDPTKPAWAADRPDNSAPPDCEAPYFDNTLDAWILSRYEDVMAAMQCRDLYPIGPNSRKIIEPSGRSDLLEMRANTLAALAPAQLRTWQERTTPMINKSIRELPTKQPTDLIKHYAQPSCLAFAAIVTGIPMEYAELLREMATPVSASAAEPFALDLQLRAKTATTELKKYFSSGPEALRESGFVALAHTLPCMLANAWLALLQAPRQWEALHQDPSLTELALEELFRHSGLVRILLRRAKADVDINGCHIRRLDRIVLRVIAANSDPEYFTCPRDVQVTRRERGHLALGAGPHSCVGAGLIRMVATTITRPLLARFATASLLEQVEWKGGSGFLSPVSLPVHLG